MAQRTQMRLHAITGSIPAIDGVSSSPAVPSAIGAENMLDVMGQVAGAIKRITGAPTFTEQAAGVFTHATASFSGELDIAGALDVNGAADIQGALNLQAGLTVAGAIDANSSADFQGAVNMQSTLDVAGAADLASTLDVAGKATLASDLELTGNADFNGALDVSGSSDLHGAVKAWGALTVEGAIDANSSADFQGAVNLQSTLTVAGAADLNDALDVALTSDLHGAVHAYGTLEVDGEATLASVIVEDLTATRVPYVGVGGALIDSAKLTFASDELAIDGTLDVTGAADVGGDFKVATNKFIVESATGNVTAAGDLIAVDGTFSGDLAIAGNLVVSGDQIIANVTTVVVEDKNIELGAISGSAPSDATADGGGITLKGSTDHTIMWDNAKDAWVFSEHLLADADASKDLGSASVQWKDLYLSGDAIVGSDLDVDGAADIAGALNLQSTLTVAGAATLNGAADFNAGITADSIKIDGDVAQRLYIVDADGSIKDEAKLTFDGSELLVSAQLEVSGAADLKSTLAVASDADLNGALDVAGASDLHGAVHAYSTLRADGAVDFNDAMDVAGASDLHGAVHAYSTLLVDGAADFKSSMLVTGSVDMLSTVHAVGNMTLDAQLDVAGASFFADDMTLDKASAQSIVKSGGDLKIEVSAGEMKLADKWNAASTWSADSIKLSAAAAEWDNFKSAFGGEVSILNAIVAANGGTAGGKFKKVIASAVSAGTAVAGSTIAKMEGSGDFAAGYAGLTAGTEKNKVDVYVNGQLMLEGASDDYEISSGNISFKFDLYVDDVVLAIVR